MSASQAESSVDSLTAEPSSHSEAASVATILLHDHHHGSQHYNHHQRRHGGDVPPTDGDAFWGTDISTLDLPSPAMGRVDEDEMPLQFMADMKKMEKYRAHYSGIQGVILLLQSFLAMAIVSLLGCIALWEAEEVDLSVEPSDTYAFPLPSTLLTL